MTEPVAIIGFALRFPGEATTEDGFWDIIDQGKSTMTEVPIGRYNIDGFASKNKSSKNTLLCRGGHFIQGDISAFDAPFFSMNSAEATAMDPQLRILLETTFHTLENAGLTLDRVQGSATSVYVGNLSVDYASLFGDDEEVRAAYQATGMSGAMLANRLSWFYDLRGPSITLDTACSSSLVGLHLACQSLAQGDSEMSLVGGVRLQLNPTMMTLPLARQNFLSPDSHCFSFDDRANGYSRGEGFGMVMLKPLSKALADGNTIRAVIRGTATNQDGRTPSISQPSVDAQAALIRHAYRAAGLSFAHTQYFEAHGTGTPVGDPIEAEAIGAVFGAHRTPDDPLQVGSVKANIGHLESTAGVASLIKTVLALEKGVIPPNAMLRNLNPRIHSQEWNLHFPTKARAWPSEGQRRASVNSFGVGGANAHVILDDALHYLQDRGLAGIHNTKSTKSTSNGIHAVNGSHTNGNGVVQNGHPTSHSEPASLLYLLTAADEGGITRLATALGQHLEQRTGVTAAYLRDLAFTLSERRTLLPWKAYAIGSTVAELRESLVNLPLKPLRTTQAHEVKFVFTGQGAQWATMGIQLMDRYPVFRESVRLSESCLASIGATWSLEYELRQEESASQIHTAQLAQPVCTALQIALVDLLAAWRIAPRAVVGHSSGEIAAAYAIGALSRASALRVAYHRGLAAKRLADDEQQVEKGAMLAVALSETDLVPHFEAVLGTVKGQLKGGYLSCGCVNSPQNVTVTGAESSIDALAERLRAAGVFVRKLNVPVAYHSEQMRQVADQYRASLVGCMDAGASSSTQSPSAVMISTVTGGAVDHGDLLQPDYWVRNLVSKVQFSKALERMCGLSSGKQESLQSESNKRAAYLVEVGPHPALERAVHDTLGDRVEFAYASTLRRNAPPTVLLLGLAGNLFARGFSVDFQAVNATLDPPRRGPEMLLDLPAYPFNHSRRYWLESRLSRNRRMRTKPRHDFLGNPSADWNPMQPKWRFTIRESDLPWIVDHKVDNTVIYPGAGFLVMVIEAVRSLVTDSSSSLAGIRIRDVQILSALVIPTDEDGIESQLQMQSHSMGPSHGVQTWDFRIYSVSGQDWKLHCLGQASAEFAPAADDGPDEGEVTNSIDPADKHDENLGNSHDPQGFYEALHRRGYHFGDLFKSLQEIRVKKDSSEATAMVNFTHFRDQMERGEVSEHLFHPATLDSLFHVMMATQYNGDTLPRVVPTHIAEIFISPDASSEDTTMLLHGKVAESAVGGMYGDITAVSGHARISVVTLRGCRLSTLPGTGDQSAASPPEPTSLFHQVHWKPDINLLSRNQTEDYLRDYTRADKYTDNDFRAEIVCRYFLSEALRDANADPASLSKKPHMAQYMTWARDFDTSEARATSDLIAAAWPAFQDAAARPQLVDEWAREDPWKAQVALFCRHLPQVLRDETDPLDLLFNQGVAEAIYRSPLLAATTRRLAAYVDLLAHQDANMAVLEVGAGTGSTTGQVLAALGRQGSREAGPSARRFRRYDFTDVSPGFFAQAGDEFARHAGAMRFRVLDLERDPVEQGFEAESYDLVIAAAVIHATASIDKTLGHIRKLLKPGGRLVFSEPTNQRTAATSGIFGVLPGWWLATEPYRTTGPLMEASAWNEAVVRAGFGELEVALSDQTGHAHFTSLLTTSLPPSTFSLGDQSTAILVRRDSQRGVGQILKSILDASGEEGTCDIVSMESVADIQPGIYSRCLSLLELDDPFLTHLDETQFAALQAIVAKFKKVVWVTTGGGDRPTRPEAAMMGGMAKALMREDPSRSIVCLDVPEPEKPERVARTVARVLRRLARVPANLAETDLQEGEDGVIYIPRVVEAPHINSLLDAELQGSQPEAVELDGGDLAEDVELRFAPGRLDSFHLGLAPPMISELGPDEVIIRVKANGLHARDLALVQNQGEAGQVLSSEVAGVVAEAGSSSGFNPGDRVCALALREGGFRSKVRVPKTHVIPMPPATPFAEAAAMPLAYATAQYALHHVARLRVGESVLILSAASGVGQAAIRIAQRSGATVYATAGTVAKRRLLVEQCGVDAGRCFASHHVSFAQQVMQRTGDRGVDVVVGADPASPARTEAWRCVAPLGRFVDVSGGGGGTRDGLASSQGLSRDPFKRSVTYAAVDMAVVAQCAAGLLGEVMREVGALVLDGTAATPHPVTVFGLSQLETAFRGMQTGQRVGRTIVSWEEPGTVQMIPKGPLDYKFSPSATYVITGGLGGIGRSLAVWMASLGARNLVLLSRSGTKSAAAKAVAGELENKGVKVYAPACDVSNADVLREVMAHVNENMPPIKGCIHGALVVLNRLFPDFTAREFQDNLDPKVRGTWNLDAQLPADLDFFVLLSSIAGVNGAASQSPYAGASAFEDAFARHRRARGRPCVSLDLGVVRDVGYVAERVDVARFLAMSMTDHKALTEDELHFMVRYACSPHANRGGKGSDNESPWESQVIGALTTPAFLRRGGAVEDHGWMRMPVFCHLYQMEQKEKRSVAAPSTEQVSSVESQLAAAKSLADAADVVTRALARRLARALAVPVEDIDVHKPPFAFGVDSLVAVELIFWFSNEVRADIPVIQILGNHTVAQLAAVAAGVSGFVPTDIRESMCDNKGL